MAGALLGLLPAAHAAVITFDSLVSGATSFAYDGDSDGIQDVVFSTTDAGGFNTIGPGTNMSYINEPGIEGTTSLAPDLMVSFNTGASGSLGFGFAMSSGAGGPLVSVTFSVFNAADALLGSTTVAADFTSPAGPGSVSSFPEGLVSLAFAGTASYATFDFNDQGGSRYIIDNFTGNFGSSETVPEPRSLALAAMALLGLAASRRRLR